MSKKVYACKRPQEAALYCTLARALRQAPEFLEGHECVVLLNVGNGISAEDYDRSAANMVLKLAAERDDIGYWMISASDKPRAIGNKFDSDTGKTRRTLIFREVGAEIPAQAMLTVDVEIDLPAISTMDFRIACRVAYEINVTASEAEAAMKYPLPQVWAALRRGRPIRDALARLEKVAPLQAQQEARRTQPPLLQDMHGYGEAKTWGLELARDLSEWTSGKIEWSDVDTGIVLSGAPGVGKTQFAAALARQCAVPIIATSLGRWQANGHLGDLLKAMRADFKKAKESAPCVLFVDELDSFGDRNSFSHDNKDYSIQVVNAFLEHLDGLDGREGIVIIGATNNIERIDPAILRPGRLDRHVFIPLPSPTDRVAILQQQLGQKLPKKHHPGLITATEGFSGADLAKLARDAKRIARRARRDVLIEDVLRVMPETVPITGKLRRSLAIHEAGHSAAVIVLEHAKFHGAMIVSHTRNDGKTSPGGAAYYELPAVAYRTAQTYRNQIVILLAGIAAEDVCLGAVADGSGAGENSDLAKATRIATLLQTSLGLGNRLRHSLARNDADLERLRLHDVTVGPWVEEVLQTEFARAKQLIRDNRTLVMRIADELDAHGTVSAAQVADLMAEEKSPEPIGSAA